MSQLFQPRADAIFRFVLWTAFLGAVVALFVAEGLSHSSYLTGRNIIQPQPTEFSHQHHAGELGIDCRYCHTTVQTAASAGMPPTHTCMTCHSQIWTNARMLAPVRDSYANNTPLVWQRVGRLPEYVYFNHSVHVDNGIGCSSCHGDMTRMQMTWQPHAFSMDFCLSCHQAPQNYLRPQSKVFDMQWQPPANQQEIGDKLLKQYHINTSGLLSDCSTCHR
ncbi:MAG: cytochrome C [Rhodospirillales bacterium 20-64-7]|nr:MAG: cytochrome C [Rhodospirillales bacterium 20-64-7]HQT77273.1 cytochrome c3 family protein [Rhodopila sp.]